MYCSITKGNTASLATLVLADHSGATAQLFGMSPRDTHPAKHVLPPSINWRRQVSCGLDTYF